MASMQKMWPCPQEGDILAGESKNDYECGTPTRGSRSYKRARSILQELQENDASMRDVVFDYLHATAFQGTPLAQAVEGPSENVR